MGEKIHIDTIVDVFLAVQMFTGKLESDSERMWLRDPQPAQHDIRAALSHLLCSQIMILKLIL